MNCKELFSELQLKRNNWANEEELRQGWIFALTNALKIDFHAERGKKDSSYNNVIIEFKAKGLFRGKTDSPSFVEAIDRRLLPYITRTAKEQSLDQSDYIGIAIDGDHICFAQVKDDQIQHGPLLPLSEVSVNLVVTALTDSYRKALTAENLIEDFGHSTSCGIRVMSALSKGLALSLNDSANNKTKMLFEEWRTLFGQVADLSTDQIESIDKTLNFAVEVEKEYRISASLFIIHTFNSLIIKLLAAEIVSTHSLTSYGYFSQNLSIEPGNSFIERLNREIEKGTYFSSAGIDGFVEEVLFSWYVDVCEVESQKHEIISSIRDILIRLSFYRTDNLTQAKSKDLLKIFYQNLVPETLRKTLGEFYTPDWLVSFTIDRVPNVDWISNRTLDPTCGSGSFLLEVIRRKIAAAQLAGWEPDRIIDLVTSSVWGFDLNPLAVQTARVNFLISIADLLELVPGKRVEIPVLLADAIYSPARDPYDEEDIVRYKIGSQIADLEITLPSELAFDRERLDVVFEFFGESIERGIEYSLVEEALHKTNILTASEIKRWKKPLENTYTKVLNLHLRNWNGIWFRIVRNFFWSSTAGKFDLIAGNPPWVRWSKLPELYRERVKPTCQEYDIFSNTPHHGGNELDISGIITYAVADKWLSDKGTLAFIITQTHFQSPSSQGFRGFKINDEFNLNPVSVDDMKDLKPFPDAANKTAVSIFRKEKSKVTSYPVPYNIWSASAGATRIIPVHLTIDEVKKRIVSDQLEATPVTNLNSPWAILPKGRFAHMSKLTGRCDWVQGRKGITTDLNGVYFVEIIAQNESNNLVKIQTRPNAGKINIGPMQEFWVEPELLYPLVKGASDFKKCYFDRTHELFAFIPNKGIIKEEYDAASERLMPLRNTKSYFASFKSILEKRSTYRLRMKNAPYYSIYNVGNYTFAPFKVVWAEQKDFCATVVSSSNTPLVGERPFVPDHKLFFVDFNDADTAYYLCGLLNSDLVIEYVKSHNISIQIGDIFKHMNLPKFNPENNMHQQIINLTMKSHKEQDSIQRDKLISEISRIAEDIIAQ